MIQPVQCHIEMPKYSGIGKIELHKGQTTRFTGDVKRLDVHILNARDCECDLLWVALSLTRGQAQQLADDINFLLG